MSGGSSKSGSAQKWAKPYATAAAADAQSVYNAAKPGADKITNSIQDLLPDVLKTYQDGNPTLQAAQGYAGNVLGGQYLNGNPYIDQMVSQTGNDVTDRVNSAIGMRGGAGGSSHAGLLARTLAESENALRYQNYAGERQNQQQAMSAAPSMAAADYLGITPLLSTAQLGAELPYVGMNNYSSALSQLMNGSSQKQGVMGSLLQGAGAIGAGFAGK